MHIAAVMAALDVSDLDHNAKMVLWSVCCRANQRTGLAFVSTGRLAKDTKLHRTTVMRAVERLETAGYMAVDRRLGKTSGYRLDLSHLAIQPVAPGTEPVASGATRRIKKDKREGGSVLAQDGENWQPDMPPTPWVYDEETGTAYRADLTVEDILNVPPAV